MPWYDDYTGPIETDKGLKARSKRGKFVEHWWADRWIEALETVMDAGRLRRGRTYARKGQVLSVEESEGGVEARVQGSRTTPYRVSIHLKALSDDEWERVLDELADQALFSADLLAGEMPAGIEDAFSAAGVALFPGRRGDLETHCSCPDWAEVCKHVAATHYILGERFDEDPFLLFRLRGRSQQTLMEELRARRGTAGPGDAAAARPEVHAPPLEAALGDAFWRLGAPLDDFTTHVEPPETPMPVLQRLGKAAFLDQPPTTLLASAYRAIQQRALDVETTNTDTG